MVELALVRSHRAVDLTWALSFLLVLELSWQSHLSMEWLILATPGEDVLWHKSWCGPAFKPALSLQVAGSPTQC